MSSIPLPTICLDFDGVLASWNEGTYETPGPPIPGAREFLAELASFGRVIISTCRTTEDLYGVSRYLLAEAIWEWLGEHGFSAYVSEVYAGNGKPLAAVYIDDKAICCDPEALQSPTSFAATLTQARAMCGGRKAFPGRPFVKPTAQTPGAAT